MSSAYHKQYYEQNKDTMLRQARLYYQANKDAILARRRKRYHADIETGRAIVRKHARKRHGLVTNGETKVGMCNICEQTKMLVPDHNHDTGQLRGWLCISCNLYLGHFEKRRNTGENTRSEAYLAEHEGRTC